jgi:murein DD-endopeptidase MepM/ murein hydrolase activator NlpD
MPIKEEFQEFSVVLVAYGKKRTLQGAQVFEKHKKSVTKKIMKRRGQLSRPVVHLGMGGLVTTIVMGSGLVGGSTDVASQYPEIDAATQQTLPQAELAAFLGELSGVSTETMVSEKPRDQILEYEVQGGDTLSSIAKKFDITVDTIKWANNLEDIASIRPGQKLKILPLTGVAHQVQRGDTVYTIAKKYDTNPQAIVDFPFNDIGENLSIRIGQVLIVPDGTPPEKPRATKAPVRVIDGPTRTAPSTQGDGVSKGSYIWPVRGLISQGYRSYHKALDIAGGTGDAIVASDGGEVIVSGWVDNSGYGNRIMIKHPNGAVTLYAHLQANSNRVKVGDRVSQGQVIGLRGSTGRSTGPHLHFEIRQGGNLINPLNVLK